MRRSAKYSALETTIPNPNSGAANGNSSPLAVIAFMLVTYGLFGVFASVDGGQRWTQLKGGMPVAQARDMTIQKREPRATQLVDRARQAHEPGGDLAHYCLLVGPA